MTGRSGSSAVDIAGKMRTYYRILADLVIKYIFGNEQFIILFKMLQAITKTVNCIDPNVNRNIQNQQYSHFDNSGFLHDRR